MIRHQPVDSCTLSPDQIIERILTIAPTLGRERLDGFAAADLDRFLAHLESAQQPRGRHARWHRDDLARPVCVRASRV